MVNKCVVFAGKAVSTENQHSFRAGAMTSHCTNTYPDFGVDQD